MTLFRGWCLLLVAMLLLPAGCATSKKKKDSAAIKEQVTESFDKLKEAIKAVHKGNTEKLWDILSEESQAEAAKKAKAFRAAFAKKSKEDQDELAQQVGATTEQIRDKLNGYGYVRLMRDRVYDRYWMVVEAPIDHIKLEAADEATVYYTQDDADKDKQSILFILEDGEWRAKLSIP